MHMYATKTRTDTPTGGRRRAATPARGLCAALCLVLALGTPPGRTATEELKIPNLGEGSSSLFSAEYEHQLGRAWLRVFRSQVATVNDPLLFSYLEDLIFRLVTHSELQDRRVELVVVDNPTINAFAVPGGVIGIHNGLLLHAQTEDELATVIAHEIAHLSQRHFSRRMEFARSQQPLTLAAMLAGFVLMATVGSDVGLATLTAAQAAAQDSALRYSRSNEAEADRVAMQTIVDAGMDPHAASTMFERMLQASRYATGNRVPEFLRTHPLSENRIADTRNRARQYPKQIRPTKLDYQLMRARVINQLADTPEEAIATFTKELNGSPRSVTATRYGLVMALTAAGRVDEAALELDSLWARDPDRLEYIIADARIQMARNEPEKAVQSLRERLRLSPGNHALTMTYAEALMQDQQSHVAEAVLQEQSRRRPDDPYLWYLLAEVQGLAGNILGLHQSRAEYFILNGILDQAEKQLRYALKLVKNDYTTGARINQRLRDVTEMREMLES
ncbi:MAG: M48 family metalloprotease [Halieaceae bacterium]|nr:M48 family metalloprotease [Halieaceae bacterium]